MATARADRSARPRSWPVALAWALFALVLLLFATHPLLDRMMRDAGRPDLALFAPFVVAPTLAALTASTVGWVLASRRPRHPVGWLLLTLGLPLATGAAILRYRLDDLDRIISRTLAWTLLTLLLTLAYAAASSGWSTGASTAAATTPGRLIEASGARLPTRASLWLRPPPGSGVA